MELRKEAEANKEPEKKANPFVLGCDSSFNARSRLDPLLQKRYYNESDNTGGLLFPTYSAVHKSTTQSYKYHDPH